jgi:hypothetical protein
VVIVIYEIYKIHSSLRTIESTASFPSSKALFQRLSVLMLGNFSFDGWETGPKVDKLTVTEAIDRVQPACIAEWKMCRKKNE